MNIGSGVQEWDAVDWSLAMFLLNVQMGTFLKGN